MHQTNKFGKLFIIVIENQTKLGQVKIHSKDESVEIYTDSQSRTAD